MKKIRMVQMFEGTVIAKKYIDLEKKEIKERFEETKEIISYNFEGIMKDFNGLEGYIDYNKRVWGYTVL